MEAETLSQATQFSTKTFPLPDSALLSEEELAGWKKAYDDILDIWNVAHAGMSPELEPPSDAVLERALKIAHSIAQQKIFSPPMRIVPDGDGGIVLSRWDDDGVYESIEISDDLSAQVCTYNNKRLIDCRPLE